MKQIKRLNPIRRAAALALGVILLAGAVSCATIPDAPAPDWAAAGALRTLYPSARYLAQIGRGRTRDAAEANGAAALARLMTQEINATQGYSLRTSQANGRTDETLETVNEAFVSTQISLSGIRYADSGWYDRTQREWLTCAYIDREEAWRIYAPRFRQQAEAFDRLFQAAAAETDPFKKVLRLMAAGAYTRSEAFLGAEIFGQILSPDRMNAEFGPVRETAASLAQRLDAAARDAAVFIDCPGDFESLVSTAFTRQFTALGFPVARTRAAAAAVCEVTIEPGESGGGDLGVFYYPSLQAVLQGPSGTLWTFSAQGEKSAAVRPDVAKRRAWTALAEAVTHTFSTAFSENAFSENAFSVNAQK